MIVAGCPHRQAEPVLLRNTGEHVACLCISCYGQLSVDWIERQRARAEREAHCDHEREVEVRRLGLLESDFHCTDCGHWHQG
jgi:hypothetical protein